MLCTRSSTPCAFSRHVAVESVGHHLGVADDGVERRAQLVAHVGQELRLVLARHLELAALLLDLGEQAHILDGDDGLGGEGLEQLDLARREGPRLGLAQHDGAAGDAALAQHRRRNCRAPIVFAGHRQRVGVLFRVEQALSPGCGW